MQNRKASLALKLRSAIFLVVFYVNTAVFLIIGSPLLLGPRRWAMAGLKAHGLASVWWLRVICGVRMTVRGLDKLPPGAALVAAKHQAAWDTFALIPLLRDPAMVMKHELMSIPLYGWFSRKFGMIPVKREAGPSALRAMLREAKDRAARGREIVIFPEGTRREPGAPPQYFPGVVMLYEELGLPCAPIALNSGLFWPRRSILRHPGEIVVEILDPIPPGLPRREFLRRLQGSIETASARLMHEALAGSNPPPAPELPLKPIPIRTTLSDA
ncbi:MAG: lysophospholipid acyltransferase family protein [Hyphomicrobiales bacterium]|nr:lysophospholipid acyltransferase family protein [Hyphomicrobiales bacterium]